MSTSLCCADHPPTTQPCGNFLPPGFCRHPRHLVCDALVKATILARGPTLPIRQVKTWQDAHDAALHVMRSGLTALAVFPEQGTPRVAALAIAGTSEVYLIDVREIGWPPALDEAVCGSCVVGFDLRTSLKALASSLSRDPGEFKDVFHGAALLGWSCKSVEEMAKHSLHVHIPQPDVPLLWEGYISAAHRKYAAQRVAVLLPLLGVLEERLREAQLVDVFQLENRVLPAIVATELAGMPVDVDALAEQYCDVRTRLDEIDERLCLAIGADTLHSPEKLRVALSRLLGTNLPATDRATLAPHAAHPVVSDLLAARGLGPLASTLHDFLVRACADPEQRVRCTIEQNGAVTGRMATRSPNLAGVPRAMRRCFVAPPGRKLVIADFAQIDLRALAQVTGDEGLIDLFRRGVDAHAQTAGTILGKPPAKVTTEERNSAKSVGFGICFGITADGLAQLAAEQYGLSLSTQAAAQFIEGFMAAYPRVREWQQRHQTAGTHVVRSASGRLQVCDDCRRALAMEVQGTTADGFKEALASVYAALAGVDAQIVNVIQDEVIVECAEQDALRVGPCVVRAMKEGMGKFIRAVPIEVDARISCTWAKTPSDVKL